MPVELVNTEIFEAAGLTLDDFPETWEGIPELCQTIKDATGNVVEEPKSRVSARPVAQPAKLPRGGTDDRSVKRRPDAEEWRNRDEKHHDPYDPEPVGHAAPEEYGGRLALDVR